MFWLTSFLSAQELPWEYERPTIFFTGAIAGRRAPHSANSLSGLDVLALPDVLVPELVKHVAVDARARDARQWTDHENAHD